MNSEEIIRKFVPDWNNWHEECKEQVLEAVEFTLTHNKKLYRWQGYRRAFGKHPVFKNIPKQQFDKIDWNEKL